MSDKRINAVFGRGSIGAMLVILLIITTLLILLSEKMSPLSLWLYAMLVAGYLLNSLAPLKWRREWGYAAYREHVESHDDPYAGAIAFGWLMIYLGLAPGLFMV